jgi:hypothetical protein
MALCALVSACTATTYAPYGEPAADGNLERRVSYDLSDAYFDDPPDCVTVLGPSQAIPADLSEVVEAALVRHLSTKIPRVLGRAQRRRVTRDLALLLHDPGDRAEYARQTSCRTFAEWALVEATSTFALVWSQQRLGLEVRLVHAGDEAPLWRAAHTASRSDGGVPLSFIGAPVSAFRAARFNQDSDILPSMIDDVLRRMFASLPASW